jgi:hypothetical protein
VTVSTITSLTDLADLFLTTSEAALATTTAGVPATSYVSPAAPAFDCCPALIIYVAALSEEVTSPSSPSGATGMRDRYGRIILATLVVNALRCSPKVQSDGSVLTTDIEAVAVEVQEDGWALWNGITCAIKNGTFEDLCSIVHLNSSQVIAEQGGCVGWQMVLRAEIGGIPCAEPST